MYTVPLHPPHDTVSTTQWNLQHLGDNSKGTILSARYIVSRIARVCASGTLLVVVICPTVTGSTIPYAQTDITGGTQTSDEFTHAEIESLHTSDTWPCFWYVFNFNTNSTVTWHAYSVLWWLHGDTIHTFPLHNDIHGQKMLLQVRHTFAVLYGTPLCINEV